MSDFKETCIWMSYRYAIGRKAIASVMHAEDIAIRKTSKKQSNALV